MKKFSQKIAKARKYQYQDLFVRFDIQDFGQQVEQYLERGQILTQQRVLELTEGNYLRQLYADNLRDIHHTWQVSIDTTVKQLATGEEQLHCMEYDINTPMSFYQLMDYDCQNVEANGEKWQGLVKMWLDDIDLDFNHDFKCEQAICTLRCRVAVHQAQPHLLAALTQHIGAVL